MKAEVLKLWKEALLSGKYKQTRNLLKDHDGFCCLGVLCDISGLGEWKSTMTQRYIYVVNAQHETGSKYINGGFSSTVLPDEVAKWAGLDNNPSVQLPDKEQRTFLSDRNDRGDTFEQIVQLLEHMEIS